MKSAEAKNSTTSSNSSKPFFNKSGEGTFFAQKKEADTPFFQPMLIQPALAVGAANDPFEQEADKVGRQVMDNFGQASSIQTKLSSLGVQTSLIQPMPIGTRISRMVQHRQNIAQAKCDGCAEEEMMAQPKSMGIQFAGEGGMVSSDIEQRINSQRGSGQSMDVQTKAAMESSFGADFSGVKIHTGTPAVQMSQELNAHAFTVGSDVFFNKGKYQPKTKEGAGLLAHELTHTVQQGAAVQNKRINRRPLSKMLSKHEMAHLSSMDSNILSRKEMAQLEMMPEEEMMQQKEVFESNEVDKVQKKDRGLSLRRCDNGKKKKTPTTPCKPTFKSLKATKGGPPVMTTAWPGGVCLLGIGIPSNPGMKIKGVVDVPAKCEGKLEFLQLIDTSFKKKNTAGTEKCIKTSGYVLDTSDPYSDKTISTSGKKTIETNDSPEAGHAPGNKYLESKDNFKMWLLWTPKNPSGAKRIALGMVTWSWGAKATKTGTTGVCATDWTVSDGSSTGGTGTATSTLPTWTKTYPNDFSYGAC